MSDEQGSGEAKIVMCGEFSDENALVCYETPDVSSAEDSSDASTMVGVPNHYQTLYLETDDNLDLFENYYL